MKILFVHQNFPAQFKHLAPKLASLGHSVTAFTLSDAIPPEWHGIKVLRYKLDRGNTKQIHPWIVDYESKVVRGEACLRFALGLKAQGYYPDVIIAHPGWGESLFLKEVWPDASLKLYCEFYYHTKGFDVGFDAELKSNDPADFGRVVLKNSNILLHFEHADCGITPTNFQASSFPAHIRDKLSVIHEGIDTKAIRPGGNRSLRLSDGRTLTRDSEVITYVNRNLEPMRGIHSFLRSVPKILRERPESTIIIVGQESFSGYGAVSESGKTWKAHFFDEIKKKLDEQQLARIVFCGWLPYETLSAVYQISTVHVYLTYPFVLSWSLMEAMSAGCAIIGSDTAPVREVIKNGETGFLVDFFDADQLAEQVVDLLTDKSSRKRVAKGARELIESEYDHERVCLPRQINWALS